MWQTQDQNWKKIELRARSTDPADGAYIRTSQGIGTIEGYLFHFIDLHLSPLVDPSLFPVDLQRIQQVDVHLPQGNYSWTKQAGQWIESTTQNTLSARQATQWFKALDQPTAGLVSFKDLFNFQTHPPSQTPLAQFTVWTLPSDQNSQKEKASNSNTSLICNSKDHPTLCYFKLTFYPTELDPLILVKPMHNDAFFHLTRSHYQALITPLIPQVSPLLPSSFPSPLSPLVSPIVP